MFPQVIDNISRDIQSENPCQNLCVSKKYSKITQSLSNTIQIKYRTMTLIWVTCQKLVIVSVIALVFWGCRGQIYILVPFDSDIWIWIKADYCKGYIVAKEVYMKHDTDRGMNTYHKQMQDRKKLLMLWHKVHSLFNPHCVYLSSAEYCSFATV